MANTSESKSPKRYGAYDTVDKLWIGDDKGPKTFGAGDPLPNGRTLEDLGAQLFARILAEGTCAQLGWPSDRIKAMEVPEDDSWHLRDELPTQMSGEEWLRRKERGVIP